MANVYDIYQMLENGITLKSGVYLTPSDIQEMEQIYRILHGIWSYEFVKENVEEAERDIKMTDVTGHSAVFYEGIYNTMQETITGDDEYDIVTRACKEEKQMKTYRVRARYTNHCYVDVEANSEEEAYDKASEIDGGDFISMDEYDAMDDSWELYDCEEV